MGMQSLQLPAQHLLLDDSRLLMLGLPPPPPLPVPQNTHPSSHPPLQPSPSQVATNKRYAGNDGYTVSEVAEKVKKDFGSIDVLVGAHLIDHLAAQ